MLTWAVCILSEPEVPPLHSVPSFFTFAFRTTFPREPACHSCFLQAGVLGKESQGPPRGAMGALPGGRPATASLGLRALRLSSQAQAPSSTVCPEEGGSTFFLGASLSLRSQSARWPLEGVFPNSSVATAVPSIVTVSSVVWSKAATMWNL